MELQDSIVLITSNDPDISDFGTGFVISQEGETTYIATCTHVIQNIGGPGRVRVEHITADAVALEIVPDVAILRVQGLTTMPTLPLRAVGEKGRPFLTAGFQTYVKQQFYIRSLQGVLGTQGGIVLRNQTGRIKAWDLTITDDYLLQPGYSGAPVVDAAGGYVIGIVSSRAGEGKRGLAISIDAITLVWPNRPASITIADQPLSMPAPVKHPTILPAERQKLAELLAQCSSMDDSDTRELIVQGLPQDIQSVMKRNRQILRIDIRHIIDACLQFDDGIITLLQSVQSFEPASSIKMKAVIAFIQQLGY